MLDKIAFLVSNKHIKQPFQQENGCFSNFLRQNETNRKLFDTNFDANAVSGLVLFLLKSQQIDIMCKHGKSNLLINLELTIESLINMDGFRRKHFLFRNHSMNKVGTFMSGVWWKDWNKIGKDINNPEMPKKN